MLKELIKAGRKFYGKHNRFATAVSLSKSGWNELLAVTKALSMNSSHGYIAGRAYKRASINGIAIFVEENQKDLIMMGLEINGEFREATNEI